MKLKSIITKFVLIIIIITLGSCKKDDGINNPIIQVPVLTTAAVTNITPTSAASGGNITSDGGITVTFRGVCWSTGNTPSITDSKTIDGTGTGSFTSNITGLTVNTIYFVRAYATSNGGTGYGGTISFTTPTAVTDIDGNVYHIVTIGIQVWMVENLKTTKFRNGDPILNLTDDAKWSNPSIGAAYCNYDNYSGNATTYGRLYNWYAVNDTRNIAPSGWHVPTEAEWTTLINYLGGENIAGGKLKDTGTTYWYSPNTGATNESGFTALPGGYRRLEGIGISNTFIFIGRVCSWWSFAGNDGIAWYRTLNYNDSIVHKSSTNKLIGYSVRCVKD